MADWPFHVPYDGADPAATAETFAALGRRLAAYPDTVHALQALTELTVELVPGARWVSVTQGRGKKFATLASSDPAAAAADALQYRLGSGPCIDAVVGNAVFDSADLAVESRWPGFGRQAVEECGTRSVLSIRLVMDGEEDLNAGLNMYSDHAGAFDDRSRPIAALLATHAAVSVGAVANREHAREVQNALLSNREIGVAMGVLMSQYRLTRDQAFDLLRITSQNQNRKLRDIATEVADTGVLPPPAPRPSWRRRDAAPGSSETRG